MEIRENEEKLIDGRLEEELDDAEIDRIIHEQESKRATRKPARTFGYDPQFLSAFLYQARRQELTEADLAKILAPKPTFWDKAVNFFWASLPYIGFGAATGTAGFFMGKNTQPPNIEIVLPPDTVENIHME